MFQLCMFYDKNDEEDDVLYSITIKCRNFNK